MSDYDPYYVCDDCGAHVACPDGTVPDCPCWSMATVAPAPPKIVPKPSAIVKQNTLLSYDDYVRLSPHTVSYEEYQRYRYLYALEADGIISSFELQIGYELIPAVKVPGINWYTYKRATRGTRYGFKQAGMSYAPDFRYQYQGVTVIEEYKAVKRTKSMAYKPLFQAGYRNKLKLWVARYGDHLISGDWFFCIVGWNQYEDLYSAFDSNSNLIDYPIANHIKVEEARLDEALAKDNAA